MNELKPCPLCGSEVGWISGSIRCSRCGLSYRPPVSMGKEKVERRWNTRNERTCEVDGTIRWRWMGPTTYYEHELSCGHVITSVDSEPPKFCEECGARVMEGGGE